MINVNTKISHVLKGHPGALDAIVSLSPKFEKLRNPLLRKVIAGRTSISMASKMGGCTTADFFEVLQPLGFEIDKTVREKDNIAESQPAPLFMQQIPQEKIKDMDVRELIESGNDPLKLIMKNIRELPNGFVLNIINSFEPTPLILLLEKQGYEAYVKTISAKQINTYFYKKTNKEFEVPQENNWSEGWDEVIQKYRDKLETIDVRELPMPLPMHSILEALDILPEEKALFVYHKRIPVFLLPELEDRNYNFRIKEIEEGNVHLLIYKK